MARDKAEGARENKASMKGEAKANGGVGRGTIKSEEHVGSTGSGIRFKMPEGCVDHSNVRGTIGKE
jgi:hypothetical protein